MVLFSEEMPEVIGIGEQLLLLNYFVTIGKH